MSFISVVVSNNYLSVVADSRGSQVYTDGRFAKVLSDNEEKINKVTKYVFYSMVGISEDAKDFIAKSNFIENIIDNKLKDKNELNNWLKSNAHLNTSILSYTIVFGGLSVDNKFRVYSIDSGNDYLDELMYETGNLGYWLFPSSLWNNNNFPNITFSSLLQTCDNTIDAIKMIQENMNNIIAGFDQSVNTNTKNFRLDRKDIELMD